MNFYVGRSELKSDNYELINDLLASWHKWCRSFSLVPSYGGSPMFKEAKSSRGWDTVDEIISHDLESSQMEAIDHIIGQMIDVHRTALQIQARNLVTGRSVWSSARLPIDQEERMEVLVEARVALGQKLIDAGIL